MNKWQAGSIHVKTKYNGETHMFSGRCDIHHTSDRISIWDQVKLVGKVTRREWFKSWTEDIVEYRQILIFSVAKDDVEYVKRIPKDNA